MGVKDTVETNPELGRRRRSLVRALVRLHDEDACDRFLSDLCTPAEIAALADRWAVAGMLQKGLPYRAIREETSVGTATIVRVARALHHGEGGYRRALDARRGGAR